MKFNILFVSAGILIIGCTQPQKQETSTSNDDVIWKASLSYCLTKEKLDWMDLKDGYELETCEIYNFKVAEQIGNFRKLINLFYDSIFSKTFPAYYLDPA